MSIYVKNSHAPYKIYRRKTRKTKGGRPVYRYYFQPWDSETLTYSTAKSTGQTNRAAAETWLAVKAIIDKEFETLRSTPTDDSVSG